MLLIWSSDHTKRRWQNVAANLKDQSEVIVQHTVTRLAEMEEDIVEQILAEKKSKLSFEAPDVKVTIIFEVK